MRFAIITFVCLCLAARTFAATPAAVVVLKGEIDEYSKASVIQRVNEARQLGAKTVILQINTYGGLVTAALDISHFLKRQDDLHIIAYVDQKAISAGAMIALSCNEIVMDPSSLLGDCAPISLTSNSELQSLEATERAKFESPILEEFADSARRNGYDPTLTAAMVSVSKVVHWVENDQGEKRFVDEPTYKKLTAEGWKPVPGVADPIDGGNSLLTVSAGLATKLGLAKEIQPSIQSLVTTRDFNVLSVLEPSIGERLIGLLGSTAARALLTTIFMLALYISFSSPGHGAAETLAVTSLAMLVGIPLLTGYAQWWEIMAIILGLVLIALEVFVIPGFGVTGITGIILVLGGLALTWAGVEPSGMPGVMPHLQGTWQGLRTGLEVVAGGMVCSLLLGLWLQRHIERLPYLRKLVLTEGASKTELPPALDYPWPLVGSRGKAVTDLRPGGSAMFFDEMRSDSRLTDVTSDSGFVSAGTEVIIREVQGNRAIVRAADA
ncbi:MAG TPA: hypothetical protein VHD56_06490 [Tepidisphaeraceae bacterium]|nr:hypothetical protein [Tepidisphaeraceae bacterium]